MLHRRPAPFNTALIVLDSDYAPAWAKKQGLEDDSLEALAEDEQVRAAVEEGIAEANKKLARVEQIKSSTSSPATGSPAATSSRRR